MTQLKFSFFRAPIQDMSSGRPDRSANQRPVFLSGNYLSLCPDTDLDKTDFDSAVVY